ncbi:endonuclease/exonuclease/phosphatase family protein [Streptomyces sp. NPDC017988]|uniref:endonuclease/exonuclease/phosphatase family protein n=1 Tax=Streptomyces sp. NPDC017988 TaxID=3365025 RepID=UPI003795C099
MSAACRRRHGSSAGARPPPVSRGAAGSCTSRLRHRLRPDDPRLAPCPRGAHRRHLAAPHTGSASTWLLGRRAAVRAGPAGGPECHLRIDDQEHCTQGELLLERLTALGEPYAVVGGDFNDRPDGRTFGLLSNALQDGWGTKPWGREHTTRLGDPLQRIDAVFATPGVQVLGCGVPMGLPGVREQDLRAATDHLPVLASVRVPATAC